eukprot:6624399-Prymnesium_polylepis.1
MKSRETCRAPLCKARRTSTSPNPVGLRAHTQSAQPSLSLKQATAMRFIDPTTGADVPDEDVDIHLYRRVRFEDDSLLG